MDLEKPYPQGDTIVPEKRQPAHNRRLMLPFGVYLLADNRWVIQAKVILWDVNEENYADLFTINNGRIAFGALILKETLDLTDNEKVEKIREKPYSQYFLDYTKYSTKNPPDPFFS